MATKKGSSKKPAAGKKASPASAPAFPPKPSKPGKPGAAMGSMAPPFGKKPKC
jgi:hypothetical protein